MLYDSYRDNLKIIATGSSAFYLDRKFKDSLAGRKRIFHLKPLNFNELLLFQDARELGDESRIEQEDKFYRLMAILSSQNHTIGAMHLKSNIMIVIFRKTNTKHLANIIPTIK